MSNSLPVICIILFDVYAAERFMEEFLTAANRHTNSNIAL